MKLMDYVTKCIDDYLEMTKSKKNKISIFIDCKVREGEKFVQIGGIIFIPNSYDAPFNGVTIRSSDLVEDWDEFEDTELIDLCKSTYKNKEIEISIRR